MTKILVISKNIVADKELQFNLQMGNYEAFLSSEIYDDLLYGLSCSQFIQHFQLIYLSEFLTEGEIQLILPRLFEEQKPVIWKMQQLTPGVELCDIDNQFADTSLKNIRELNETILSSESNPALENEYIKAGNSSKKTLLLDSVDFTKKELQILNALYETPGSIVTKENLCEKIWNQELDKSKKVQIYTLISRIKGKLAKLDEEKEYIKIHHGIGFLLTADFFEDFSWTSPY